jgi:hypothetical protein
MDEDSGDDSDVSFGDAAANSPPGIELFSNSEDDDEGEVEEVKSLESSDSEMEDDGWRIDTVGNLTNINDNDECDSDIANDSDDVQFSDYTYDHLCDSEDNESEPNLSPDVYEALSESEDGYDYLTDTDDYGHDDMYEDNVSDLDYY